MSRMTQRRQSSSEDEGGGANWMDTYGDLVTLLLTFFVFLFAFSSIDAEKWKDIVGAFSGATVFSVPTMDMTTAISPAIPSFNTISMEETIDQTNLENFRELYQSIAAYMDENNVNAELLANPETLTLIIRFSANVLFTSGSATISPDFSLTMDHMITILAQNADMIGMIRIEGHTDNVPINTFQFEDNWALSSARATNVLRYFIASGGVDVTKISAVGYGEFQPVDTNDSPEGRAKNRRVDFVIESVTVNTR